MKYKKIIIPILLLLNLTIVNALGEIENYKTSKTLTTQPEFVSSITEKSKNNDEIALLISSGNIELKKLKIEKGGDSTSQNELASGTNSGLLILNGGRLTTENGTFTTYGTSSNAIFSSTNTNVTLNNSEIMTYGKNSSCIVTVQSNLTGTNMTLITDEENSPAIRAYNGSNINITSAEIETVSKNSPLIITEGNVSIKDSNLNSNISSAITIKDKGSINLENTTIYSYDEAEDLSNSKNIHIYSSSNTNEYATFNATNSNISSELGEIFYIQNNNVNMTLSNNTFNANSSNFLKMESSSKNNVNLNLDNQEIKGNIVIDDKSSINISLKNESKLIGSLLGTNKGISLTLDDSSILVLTGNSYITSLVNSKIDNSNIYLNGFKLFLNNKEVEGNKEYHKENNEPETTKEKPIEKTLKANYNITIAIISIVAVLIIAIIIIIIITSKKIRKK